MLYRVKKTLIIHGNVVRIGPVEMTELEAEKYGNDVEFWNAAKVEAEKQAMIEQAIEADRLAKEHFEMFEKLPEVVVEVKLEPVAKPVAKPQKPKKVKVEKKVEVKEEVKPKRKYTKRKK